MSVKLLDCTLRDGGYVNDWNFGYQNIKKVIEKLCSSNVEYVEMGFLDETAPSTIERSLMANMEIANQILDKIDKKNTKIMAMIDFGLFDKDKILPKDKSLIDGIRVIFKKDKMKEALEYCEFLKSLGYEVSANAVMINKYSKEEFRDLIELANIYKPDTLTFVDTYGVFTNKDVVDYYNMMDKYLDKDITIGFHSHNSLQLSFSNTMLVASLAKDRNVAIDGSLYGMGKSAGNACTELLMSSLNKYNEKEYNISNAEQIIEDIVLPEYKKKYWGYNVTYFIAAETRCHYNYINYFHNEKSISYSEIYKIIEYIPLEDRYSFSKEKAEQILKRYFSQKKYIIFDLDGTLFDTEAGILNSLDYTVSSFGYEALTKKDKKTFIGPPLFESFRKKYNLSYEDTRKMVDFYRNYYQQKEILNYKVYDNIEKLLIQLKEEGYTLAIATNKREDLANKILEDSSLMKYFTLIKGTDANGKLTKEELINSIIDELDAKGYSIAMVSDTMSDYLASQKCNISFIGVTYGFGFNKTDNENEDIVLVDTVDQLSKKLKRRSYEN